MLRSGGVVVDDPDLVHNGHATLATFDGDAGGVGGGTGGESVEDAAVEAAPTVEVPAYVEHAGLPGWSFAGQGSPVMIVPPDLVARQGLASTPTQIIFATSRIPTPQESQAFFDLTVSDNLVGYIEPAGLPHSLDVTLLTLILASGLITVVTTVAATSLAAAEGRADLTALAAVGASPRLRRGLSFSRAAVIAGLGSVLGTIAGVGMYLALMTTLDYEARQQSSDIWIYYGPAIRPISWPAVSAGLLIVPAVAILGAGLLTRSRLRVERRAGH
jgi:putative ABC transport system permease protein